MSEGEASFLELLRDDYNQLCQMFVPVVNIEFLKMGILLRGPYVRDPMMLSPHCATFC